MSNATVVGADAHIGPAECTVFMELFGESVTSRRVDVGIDPYEQVGSCLLPDLSGAPAPVHDMKLAGQ